MATNYNSDEPEKPWVPRHGDDRRVRVGRDASGNAFVTGDNNHVTVIIYQSVASRRDDVEPRAEDIGPNPYMGLLAFHEEDADRFFGREAQTTRLWEKLCELQSSSPTNSGQPRLLPIVGPSGSGKSSLARAGLIPELARRPLPGWRTLRVAVLTPGSHPLESLAAVLARIATGDPAPVEKTIEFERVLARSSAGNFDGLRRITDALPEIARVPLIVLVDQFEEIYSLCDDKAAREAFIENLLNAASDVSGRTSVAITLRTDFLGETQSHELLNRTICEQQVMVPAMSEAELRSAIARPAELAGHPLDDAMITLLTSGTKDRSGALPLLQFALQSIWDGISRGISPADTYKKIGGVGGALAGKAQSIYESLGEKDKQIAKRVFLGLVQLGEGTRDTRRRAVVENLVAVGESSVDIERVIHAFSDRKARLITLSSDEDGASGTAEVTHEALFDHWKQLNEWLDENRDDIRFSRRLEDAAQTWDCQGRSTGDLWRPPTLDLLRQFYVRLGGGLNPSQMAFYTASDLAEKARIAKEKTRVDRERRHKRTLRALVGILAAMVVVVIVLLGFTRASRSALVAANTKVIISQLENLTSAVPSAVPSIVDALKQLAANDPQVVGVLSDKLKATNEPHKVSRLQLGLLTVAGDKQYIRSLTDRMLKTYLELDEFLLLRDQLAKNLDTSASTELWNALRTESTGKESRDSARWLRIVGALAKFDSKSENWKPIAADAAEQLVRQEPYVLRKWIDSLQPISEQLLPRLKQIYSSQEAERASARANTALAMAQYLSAEPNKIAALLTDYADSPQTFRPLASSLPRVHPDPAQRSFRTAENEALEKIVAALEGVLAQSLPATFTKEDVPERDRIRSRQANAGMILLYIGESDKLWPFLSSSDNPTLRTYLIQRFQMLGIELERFYPKIMDGRLPLPAQQALILALGTYPPYPISTGELNTCASHLLTRFERDPDTGIHSATQWTLNQWSRDQRLQNQLDKMRAIEDCFSWTNAPQTVDHHWYINSVKQTMVIIPAPGEIEIGSPNTEIGRRDNENLVQATVDWRYAIANTEVTYESFRPFLLDEAYLERVGLTETIVQEIANNSDTKPVVTLSWYVAAAYCNWLTEQEMGSDAAQAQLCYAPNEDGKFAEGMRIVSNFIKRTGYRLPMEVEWEYACRASAKANFPWAHGDAERLLDLYAVYSPVLTFDYSYKTQRGSIRNVAELRPNNFGLFDMHGNLSEWCQDRYKDIVDSTVDLLVADSKNQRVERGGSINEDALRVRSAFRDHFEFAPGTKVYHIGFRVARTYP